MTPWKKFKPKDEDELRKNIKEYAQEAGINPNPNTKVSENVIMGLLKRKEKFGEVYCPCRVITGVKEKDEEIICPCAFHREEIETDGHCKCFLFVKK